MSDKESDDSEHINIQVTKVYGGRFNLKIKRNTKIEKLMDKYCDRLRLQRSEVTFAYKRSTIVDEDTVESLDMQEGDIIKVFLQSQLINLTVANLDGS